MTAAENDEGAAHASTRDRSTPRNFSQDMEDLWSRKDGARWLLEADGTFDVFAGERPAVLRYDRDPTDGLYDRATASVRDSGNVSVSDLRVTFDVTPRDDLARLRLRLGRGEQLCEAVLVGDEPGVAFTVDGIVVARNDKVSIPAGEATQVRFSRVDYVLRLDVAEKEVLRFELPAPAKPKRDGPAAFIEAQLDTGSARIRPVRVERDVHWTSDHGEEADVTLGPDEFFMAGDNSSNSSDSRAHGPVRRERLVGRPMLIVWPFSRFRIPR